MTSEELERLAELRAAYEASGKTINEEDAWQAWTSSIHSAAPELIALAKWAELAKTKLEGGTRDFICYGPNCEHCDMDDDNSHPLTYGATVARELLAAYPGQAR